MTTQNDSPKGPEQAPPNGLPTWAECLLRVKNADWIAKKIADGGYDATERETDKATQLHRFIYEYDDADPYRSAWFLHRLELVLKERDTQSQRELEEAKRERNLNGEECVRLWEERNRAIRELAEVKRERDISNADSYAAQNKYVALFAERNRIAKERDRYRELCEEALSVFDNAPIRFSRDNVQIIAKLREAANPPITPSDTGPGEG